MPNQDVFKIIGADAGYLPKWPMEDGVFLIYLDGPAAGGRVDSNVCIVSKFSSALTPDDHFHSLAPLSCISALPPRSPQGTAVVGLSGGVCGRRIV